MCGFAYNAIPSFLKKTDFANVDDGNDCPFQEGLGTDKDLFEWYAGKPENLEYFMKWLQKHRGARHWTDTDLVQSLASKSTGDDTILFVDVGGNVGNVCVELRKREPSLKGRVINQDLPHVVANTIEYPRVERSAHDFWTPQVRKGMSLWQESDVAHAFQVPRSITCETFSMIGLMLGAWVS